MRNIFIGLLFIFLDFNLDFGAMRVGLIPDFIGYIMILQGLKEIALLSEHFGKAKPFTIGMIVYTSVLYAADFFGLWTQNGTIIALVLGLVSVAVSLYISYHIVMGVRDLEAEQERFLNGEKLYNAWKLLAIFSVIAYVLIIVPVLGLVSVIASFVFGIMFLVVFNQTKNLYYT